MSITKREPKSQTNQESHLQITEILLKIIMLNMVMSINQNMKHIQQNTYIFNQQLLNKTKYKMYIRHSDMQAFKQAKKQIEVLLGFEKQQKLERGKAKKLQKQNSLLRSASRIASPPPSNSKGRPRTPKSKLQLDYQPQLIRQKTSMNKGTARNTSIMSPKRASKKYSSFEMDNSLDEYVDKTKKFQELENEKRFRQLEKRMEKLMQNSENLRHKPKINKLSKDYYGVIGQAKRSPSKSIPKIK